MPIINGILFVFTDLLLILFLFASIMEKEKRAVIMAIIFFILNSAVWIIFYNFKESKAIYSSNLINSSNSCNK